MEKLKIFEPKEIAYFERDYLENSIYDQSWEFISYQYMHRYKKPPKYLDYKLKAIPTEQMVKKLKKMLGASEVNYPYLEIPKRFAAKKVSFKKKRRRHDEHIQVNILDRKFNARDFYLCSDAKEEIIVQFFWEWGAQWSVLILYDELNNKKIFNIIDALNEFDKKKGAADMKGIHAVYKDQKNNFHTKFLDGKDWEINVHDNYNSDFMPVHRKIIKHMNEHDGGIFLFHGIAGSGKAQPLDSKILTPDGWRLMGEIKEGDDICTPNGKKAPILKIFPQGKKEIYEVTFSDGSKTQCCEDHLWKIDYWQWGYSAVLRLKDLIKMGIRRKSDTARKFTIPITKTTFFNEKPIFIEPYLMGILLGDGGLTGSFPTVSTADKEIVDMLEKNIYKGYKLQKVKNDKYGYRLVRTSKIGRGKTNTYINALRKYELWGLKSDKKFIPDAYIYNSVEIRIALLQGLLDADGYVEKSKGKPIITITSEKIKDGVISIINSLGGTCKVTSKIPSYTYNGKKLKGMRCFVIYICLPNDIIPFRLKRKINALTPRVKYFPEKRISSIIYVGKKESQCILVGDTEHLYITDDFIVTHNTFYIRHLSKIINRDFIYITPNIIQELSLSGIISIIDEFEAPVLILEDMDDIISQKSERNIQTIDALNIADGIMSDLLTAQIIITFNTDIKRIDPALMRSGRLNVKYEFGKLAPKKADALKDKLGKKKVAGVGEMVLADIYNMDDMPVNKSNKKKIGF